MTVLFKREINLSEADYQKEKKKSMVVDRNEANFCMSLQSFVEKGWDLSGRSYFTRRSITNRILITSSNK